jgi:hypothetical protein
MKTIAKFLLTAAAIAALIATADAQVPNNYAFLKMLADTGCESRYSDDKKADLFKANYKNREMIVTGEIKSVSSGKISLKVLPSTLTSDVRIALRDPSVAYDLQKSQRLTVRFIVNLAGGCILDYSGDQGVIVQ